jgi:hypothetical protein
LAPEQLGGPTTITLVIKIDPQLPTAPRAVSSVDLSFPANLGLGTSGLGLAACALTVLEQGGFEDCPADSKMGSGSARVGVAFGADLVEEQVLLGLYAAPSSDGYLHLAILATGKEPISAQILMTAVLRPGRLSIAVPPIPSVPGASDVALLAMKATLGGALTYFEHRKGRVVPYQPRGIGLPDRCPSGGWRFAARVGFMDGGSSQADSAVSCPPSHAKTTAR